MLLSLSIFGGSQEKSVGAGRGLHDELIKGHALSTSLGDSGSGSFGEFKSSDGHFGYI